MQPTYYERGKSMTNGEKMTIKNKFRNVVESIEQRALIGVAAVKAVFDAPPNEIEKNNPKKMQDSVRFKLPDA